MIAFQLLSGRRMFLEFKGAYFLPTSSDFKDCYKGSALFGPEFTIQLKKNKPWYAFASIDYFKQQARCLSLCDATHLRMVPLAVGVKYFAYSSRHADLYLGLGFQPTYLQQKSKRTCVTSQQSAWAFGGIAKAGSYIHLPYNFLIDLFIDYSFAWTSKNRFYGYTVDPKRFNVSGAIFGASLGYRF